MEHLVEIVRILSETFLTVLNNGHTYLKRYKVIAIIIIGFCMWQSHELAQWYMSDIDKIKDWQNASILGLIASYVAILKFALEHILHPDN